MKQSLTKILIEGDSMQDVVVKTNDFLIDKSPGNVMEVFYGETPMMVDKKKFDHRFGGDLDPDNERKVASPAYTLEREEYHYRYYAVITYLKEE